MKVSLVVAAGAHEGRSIPLVGPQFLIGRDTQCHLRPASQAISKLHCAVLIRDGKVIVKDFGSTNGTMVNDVVVQDAEVVVQDGASLRVGPLDFRIKVETSATNLDGTPLPGGSAESAALAAVKASTAAVPAPKTPARDTTPSPVRTGASGAVPKPAPRPTPAAATKPPTASPSPSAGSKEAPEIKPGSQETPTIASSESVSEEDHDRIAAMLLGMDDGGNGSVPDGSTVMDVPSPLAGEAAKADDKDKKKPVQTREEMSSAANDLLRKYMRRPK